MPPVKAEIVGLFTALIIYTIFIVWFLILLLRHFNKREEVHEEQRLREKYKAEKELYHAQLEIQEQTFVQVSREIHDNVGQFLSLAKLGLATLDLEKKEDAEVAIAEVSEIIEKSVSDLRDISRSMNADLVKKLGLKKAIESQIGFLERIGNYHVQFECEGDIAKINAPKEVILYRILQESINNIIKHSGANEIIIFLSLVKNQLRLFIQDNGYGFDSSTAIAGYGSTGGIYNMRDRAYLINAEFTIESKLGQGTKIMVTTTV